MNKPNLTHSAGRPSPSVRDSPSPKKRILLADDDPAVRESLARLLSGEDYLVLPAANGEEALFIASASDCDLVLLDLNMPVKNGWDTFERLTYQNPMLPVIIITARPNQLFPALASGAGALMEKPLDFPKLLLTMRELLEEPAETRLARLVGRPAEFHYLPHRQTVPGGKSRDPVVKPPGARNGTPGPEALAC